MSTRDRISPYTLSFFDRADAVVVMAAYFDASSAGEFLGVGGYLFRKKFVKPFEKEWNGMRRKFGLDFFHMTDCNAQQGPFQHLEKPDCDAAARMAIASIKKFAAQGFSAATQPVVFRGVSGAEDLLHNPFSACVSAVLAQCGAWAEENDPDARIFYVFEAGDDHQADAHKILQSIADNPKRRARYHYEDHAFLTKRGSLPTQAADILAWHVSKQWDREQRGIDRLRGDFSALVESIPTRKDWLDRERLGALLSVVTERAPVPNAARVAGLSLRVHDENERAITREIASLIRGD